MLNASGDMIWPGTRHGKLDRMLIFLQLSHRNQISALARSHETS